MLIQGSDTLDPVLAQTSRLNTKAFSHCAFHSKMLQGAHIFKILD